MSIQCDYELRATVREKLETGVPAATKSTVTQDGFNSNGSLNATSTPAVSKAACFEQALTAGAATIDLTALPGIQGNVDGTGLKLQVLKIINKSGNTHPLVIVPGAANGYNLLGAASKITLNPGEEFLWKGVDSASVPDVAAGAKTIDLSDGGAGGTETHRFVIVLG